MLLNCQPREYGSGGVAADGPVATIRAAEIETDLATAVRHVAQGRLIVAQQQERIARLKARGSCTRDFELTLGVFLCTLKILEDHEQVLRASAEKLAAARRRSAH